ncbi:MAG TPA: PKD domain-containing protein [Candidatus Hydrogenedentes bacterium]|nr:PKD domain-containing protein [Candidatus Hydrogenedentota bacterium]
MIRRTTRQAFPLPAITLAVLWVAGCPPYDPGAPPIEHPTVRFEGKPVSGTPPLTVQFTQESYTTNDAPITGWLWRFGDGAASMLPDPEHTYRDAGVYSVALTVAVPGATTTVTREDYIMVDKPTSGEGEDEDEDEGE